MVGKVKFKLLTLSSFEVQFQSIVKTHTGGQARHDLWGSNMKIGKYLTGGNFLICRDECTLINFHIIT